MSAEERSISIQLFAAIAQDAPSDNHQIDLLGTLEDVIDLGVAHPLLNQFPARVADRPQQLDCLLGDERDHLAGLSLGHRGLEVSANCSGGSATSSSQCE